ncbi:MAG: flagellar assembly peptidoglycan hydrolase FlgJ, partial [Gammaproteobacteria bacterium]|nr:flagellar assembly peptidoglycan hydrolase FlgJ [Gammaproteobacteria bacterium]
MNSTGAIYNDFNGLANLKAKAGEGENNPEVTRETARQFEALFVQMMLKSMRSAGGEFSEKRDTTYEEMFDQQIAIEMTSNRGIGIADMLVRQLNNGAEPAAVESGSAAVFDASAARYYGPDQSVKTGSNDPEPMARMDWKPGSPDEFIQDIWPHAEEAADKLGIDPRTLIAQAALETGWGQKLIRDGSGISGNNLFGIKADTRWDGESVKVSTLEYEKGSPY